MRFTLSWLKRCLDTKADLNEIVETLNKIGLVVESLENPGEDLKDFIVVEVRAAEPHPNADRLRVCQVFTGSETLQVVCGAPNARAGMKAVLAPIGTLIPALGTTLRPARIRDVESQGMLCSFGELKLAGEQEGIIEVDATVETGKSYVAAIGLDDVVFDIELTANRGDCLGVYGIARDLMATGIGQLRPLQINPVPGKFSSPIKLALQAPETCPVFMGRVIRNVKNNESPQWLQNYLKAIGVKTISALVDITNFMAYHLNRPMHVFDADKINGDLTIRLADPGESLKALDDKTYALSNFMTVIADQNGPCSLGGIMGGLDSACTLETTTVFLESAYFEGIGIAKTGRELGILSDSRYRFERWVDPALVQPGIELATQMILDICGGEPSDVMIAGKVPDSQKNIDFNLQLVKSLGGVTVSEERIQTILKDLGFICKSQDRRLQVTVPSWRHDIDGPADLVEEVIRIVGYDAIELEDMPAPHPDEVFESFSGSHQLIHRNHIARRALAARGMCECQTWAFLSREQAELFGGVAEQLVLTNPISKELEVMRPSLLPQIIDGVKRNQNRSLDNSALFEIGAHYRPELPNQQEIVIAAVRSGDYSVRHWLTKARLVDVFDIKADFFSILESYGIGESNVQIVTSDLPSWYHPGRAAQVQLGGKTCLGFFGEIHPKILKALDVQGPIMGFELLVGNVPLSNAAHRKPPLTISPFQGLSRDFAFLFDDKIAIGQVIKTIGKTSNELINSVDVFDVYKGEGVPTGKKSVAITVGIEPQKHTLTDKEINELMEKIISAVRRDHGGELRL